MVFGGLFVLGAIALLVASLPPLTLLWCALGITGVGCAIGLPTGFMYHVVLRRELSRAGQLKPGWFWRPIQQHVHLEESALDQVRPWLVSGGVSFLLIMLGLALLIVTMVTHFR